MKLQGIGFDGPNKETLVLIRNGRDLVFQAQAVLDFSRFEALCPKPLPRKVKKPGGEEVTLTDHPDYSKAIDRWSTQRTDFTIIESLKATPGLEWETIKDDDPDSWGNYEKELKTAFFSGNEVVQIINLVWSANGVNQARLDEALKRFLAGQVVEPTS